MRIVALEEHFNVPALVWESLGGQKNLGMSAEVEQRLGDLDTRRIDAMDEAGIALQIISATFPGADRLDGDRGISFAKRTNDVLGRAVRKHPGRFAGFAHLPMRSPGAAAEELERCVVDLGFRGALINGTTKGDFLDHPRFGPVLAKAAALDVPVYLHPNLVPDVVVRAYYDGLPKATADALAGPVYGWHSEVVVHVLRMAVTGTFAKHPGLRLVIGHMGEGLPFMMGRAEDAVAKFAPLDEPLGEILRRHLYLTTSGFFTFSPLQCAIATFGIDRIMFSVDYPYADNKRAVEFLRSVPVAETDRAKLASRNATDLFRLDSATPTGVQ